MSIIKKSEVLEKIKALLRDHHSLAVASLFIRLKEQCSGNICDIIVINEQGLH